MFDRARGQVLDLGYAAGWGAVKALPYGVSARAFRVAADAATARNGGGVRQLRKNLRRVVGPDTSEADLDRIVRDSLRSYARYWLETFRLPKMDHGDVALRTDKNTEGVEHIDEAMARGRGMILALPHMANWDAAAIWLIRHGVPFTTVAERLKPESLFDRFVAYRESLGMEVVALTGGQRAPADVLSERLRAGGAICLVADRDLSRNGIEVQFFGEPTRMPAGPSLLAATTGAALLPVSLWFTDDGWAQRIGSPIELSGARLRDQVAAGTQAIADTFAREIADHPTDWHMLQRLWLADLQPRPTGPAEAVRD
ncbi:MAG: KDO2-lipid lauroyltransferase [Pseudonocardiales bacterium]|nr:KDO2-lipid lauroyltransferase [Pseudonocardiales bacterium]